MKQLTLLAGGVLLLGFIGCGGGGGGGSVATGTVKVVATDALGAPVELAISWLYVGNGSMRGITDASGEVTFEKVPSGLLTVVVDAASDTLIRLRGSSVGASLAPKGELDLAITLWPDGDPSVAILGTSVAADGVQDEGRSLEFAMRIADTSQGLSVWMLPCEPQSDNDEPSFTADCVLGPPGTDAWIWGGEPVAEENVGETFDAYPPAPYSALLLVDQSSRMVENDPWDSRLYGAKVLAAHAPGGQLAVAAFAADNPAVGDLSPLPEQPLTVLSTGVPGFQPATSALFPALDSLADLEGGQAPLYAALDGALDYIDAYASTTRRFLVVLSDGVDESCGAPAECLAARQGIVDKSRALGIPIISIGTASPSGDRTALYDLAGDGGAVLWVRHSSRYGLAFMELGTLLDGSAALRTVTFRLESPTTGAFQSGYTVFGELVAESCYWDCFSSTLPIAVRIP